MADSRLFSFEFSAPKTEEAIEQVKKVHARLSDLSPHFFSVTYGAGGSTKDGTRQTVLDLSSTGSVVAPHISFGGDTPEVIEELLNNYKDAGISRLVALRGDRPSGIGSTMKMIHANELVEFIRSKTGDHFHIDVAAYPEVHPESDSVDSEIHYFKKKADAGANSAITQYFYNADAYFRFRDACTAAGIDIPIVPGIMPITNYKGLVRFSSVCGAEIPRWIEKHLITYEKDAEALKAFGTDVVTDMCQRLLDGGAPGLHFYTLNQSLPTLKIWNSLALS
ncbi:MAG: methylenetetrahydrofolate reductase [NAD(P)H] [Gammaproteobacteria bacterium]|jgi:methylenetetrahydrofolate reductase (NADPH)|nr:methylenetetrahydrofolate reductase [NAD(P)H] [Gammaproteobacteria bacterium]MBT4493903.1 methylenetetrahydrofolate reductase [NAD(P)H] [Gammaproteobacteria bacterium]MBT7372116.1 methylenetetrahydrofolate reductase [NAD(P)H] [Gammaproteobacteria bacterium]